MKPYIVGVWADETIAILVVRAESEEDAVLRVKSTHSFNERSEPVKCSAKELPAEIGEKPTYLIDLWD
jgi:hypothetical protein